MKVRTKEIIKGILNTGKGNGGGWSLALALGEQNYNTKLINEGVCSVYSRFRYIVYSINSNQKTESDMSE